MQVVYTYTVKNLQVSLAMTSTVHVKEWFHKISGFPINYHDNFLTGQSVCHCTGDQYTPTK